MRLAVPLWVFSFGIEVSFRLELILGVVRFGEVERQRLRLRSTTDGETTPGRNNQGTVKVGKYFVRIRSGSALT